MKSSIEISKNKKYRFNPDWYNQFAHADIDKVVDELELINESFGQITAENIVTCAKNKKSVLHSYFTWDDKIAAEKFRIKQAAILLANIQVVVIRDGHPKFLRAYETVVRASSKSGITVKKIDSITDANITQIINFSIGDLNRIINRLSRFDNTKTAIFHITKAIHELKKSPETIPIESSVVTKENKTELLLADEVRLGMDGSVPV